MKDELLKWRQTVSVLALGIRGLRVPEDTLWFHAQDLAALADQLADRISQELEVLEAVA